jgi:hypothetical protein
MCQTCDVTYLTANAYRLTITNIKELLLFSEILDVYSVNYSYKERINKYVCGKFRNFTY